MPRIANPDRDRKLERELRALQRRIAKVPHLLEARNHLLVEMADRDYSHRMLAEMLSEANAREGGAPLTSDAVQKAIRAQQSRR